MPVHTKIGIPATDIPISNGPDRYNPNSLRISSTASSFSQPKNSISRSVSRPSSQTFTRSV